jgi:hypothetical protein
MERRFTKIRKKQLVKNSNQNSKLGIKEAELIWRESRRLDKIQREEEKKSGLQKLKKHKDDEVDKFNRLVKLSEQYDKTL